jgi:RNA polymerase sigma factor (sigma-70 family)
MARHGPPQEVPAISADRIDLHHALGRLAPLHREVLILHYVAELPVEEVARQLRLPVRTVKSRLHRARGALAAQQVGDERQGVANA